jgi:multicomponent Na+:H+ antiporter subunit F
MIHAAIFILLIGVFLLLYRAMKGPTVFDRILAANSMGTKAILLVTLIGSLSEIEFFLDTAVVYCLINFIGTLAICKYFEKRRLA